jgi:hypothetical protein
MRILAVVRVLIEIGGVLLFGLLLGILSVGVFPLGYEVLLILLILRETAHETTRGTTLAAGRRGPHLPNPLSRCRVSQLFPHLQQRAFAPPLATGVVPHTCH